MNEIANKTITLSTVTPVYSGEEYLPILADQLDQLRTRWEQQSAPLKLVECIFVNDGSIDDSALVLKELDEKYSWITVITLSRNYGQHAATVAGICHTFTDWVVTLDEDLQHKPEHIEDLLKAQVEHNADIIYARPASSAHGNSWRDKSSNLVKSILAKLTSTPQIRLFNSFRLMRGSIARAAASSSSSNTYFDIAISWFTKSCNSIDLQLEDKRFVEQKGSGYGFIKLVKHARRLIVSSEFNIASVGLTIGMSSILFAFFIAVISIFQKIFFPETINSAGWTSLITVVTFFSGIIIALLCIALEYLNVTVLNNLGRPTFFTVDRSQDRILSDWLNKK